MGRRLRAFRLARGMSQKELADKASIVHSEISRAENGLRPLAVRQIRSLAKALRIHPGDFL